MIDKEALLRRASEWIDGDPDEHTRHALQSIIDTDDVPLLDRHVAGFLEFGTAGLRGAVGPGPSLMNRAVVIKATRGIVDTLISEELAESGVVVGYDARSDSRQFMEDAVGVLAAAGITVRYFDEPVPTPLVAFTAKEMGTSAAIVVTASHNPATDSGFKVYWKNAVQIVPPTDLAIRQAIHRVGPAKLVPRIQWSAMRDYSNAVPLNVDETFAAYRTRLPQFRKGRQRSPLRIVYSAMHGVGGRYLKDLLEGEGHTFLPVAEQFAPDGSFPTAPFPNPEEPGTLDLATALASNLESVDLILANDPDADRLAVVVPDGDSWRQLSGNQVGVLLGDWCLSDAPKESLVISSVVSSPMLEELARLRGASHATTLTGFKWIWNAALDLIPAGRRFVFGFEEAIGYSVGDAVRDKDGLSAAVVLARVGADLKARGSNLLERLGELYGEAGVWVSSPVSIRSAESESAEVELVLDRLVADPPEELGGLQVMLISDFRHGPGDRPRYMAIAPLIVLALEENGRCLVRPSGTEPKMKVYVELKGRVLEGEHWREAEERMDVQARRVAFDLTTALGVPSGSA